jgi:hypothetical protein
VSTNTNAFAPAKHAEIGNVSPRTEIADISELGPELDEGQLMMVAGGQHKDGGYDSNPCPSGCH